MRKSAAAIFIILLALFSCSKPQPPQPSTIVLVVRHAEKAADAEDSPLTETGTARAQALVRVAEGAGVSAIYTTQFRRNRDTAQPISDRLKLAPPYQGTVRRRVMTWRISVTHSQAISGGKVNEHIQAPGDSRCVA